MSSESWACNCMGPQNGEPFCPCMMNRLGVIKQNGRWIEPAKDLGPVIESIDYDDFLKKSAMPFSKPAPCTSVEHNAPTHLYVPPGEIYVHECPECGKRSTIAPPNITFGLPDKSIVAPEFTITTESFEPYTFSTEEDGDAFTAESDDEILDKLCR